MHIDHIKVLAILNKKECTSELKANTIKQLMPELQYCYSKTHNILTSLCMAGYVDRGIKNCRAETYYITDKGIKEIGRLIKA